MKTLNENYKRNVEILKINLERGMTAKQANQRINGLVSQFTQANLYDTDAKDFINEMRATVIEYFTDLTINLRVVKDI